MVNRVDITPAAAAMVSKLTERHGPLLFHQSGGCCDGSAPMCYPLGEFHLGSQDVYLGEIASAPFYMSAFQYEYWQHTHLTIDLVPGRGSSFSVEAPEGVRFITRSRLFSEAELAELANSSSPPEQGSTT
ncbi:MAG: UDP-glucose 4-epimerase [Rhodocyclales bacterium GWA2_65_20]|nr:MAG: UDP-glucose 4-epimerase [Rhodocyclales bacterium GWA2_65_20]